MMAPSDASMFQWLYVRTPLLSPSMLSRRKMGGWAFFWGGGGRKSEERLRDYGKGEKCEKWGRGWDKKKGKRSDPFHSHYYKPHLFKAPPLYYDY